MHARSQQRHESDAALPPSRRQMGKYGLVALLDSLQSVVSGLSWQGSGGGWADYYDHTNYSEEARNEKLRIVGGILSEAAPRTVWDLGANTGLYSEAAVQAGAYTIAFDSDGAAVERHYRRCLDRKEPRILPLVLDLSNPSGGTGWANRERASLSERGPADVALALALIHHLAIGNNVPFERIAEFLAETGRTLLIEFVPKDDSQVQRMLATREDVFAEYTAESFERAFARHFRTVSKSPIRESGRTIYRMEQRRT
jgi:ribosomal protein L11 methylase PrmA